MSGAPLIKVNRAHTKAAGGPGFCGLAKGEWTPWCDGGTGTDVNGDVGVKGERRWDTQDGEGEGRIVESILLFGNCISSEWQT